MNTTYTTLELKRVTRDYANLFFIAGLPAFLYVIFGAASDFGDDTLAGGNVTMYVMVSMAAYGAVMATTSLGGMAAVERMQGWGRQLALTPMSDSAFIASKAIVALTIAALPVALIFLIGFLSGAEGSPSAWIWSAVIVTAGATTFALFGLAVGQAFRTEGAVSAAAGSLVILAFLGNVFMPLSGALLTFAKFTPLYGYVALARYPVTDGVVVSSSEGALGTEALWIPALNVGVWTLIFAVAAVWLVRRGRSRQ